MRFRLSAQPNGDVWNDPVRGPVTSDGPYAETCLDAIARGQGRSRSRKGNSSYPLPPEFERAMYRFLIGSHAFGS